MLQCRCVPSRTTGCRYCAVPCAMPCEAQAGSTSKQPKQRSARHWSAQLLLQGKSEAEQLLKKVTLCAYVCAHAASFKTLRQSFGLLPNLLDRHFHTAVSNQSAKLT